MRRSMKTPIAIQPELIAQGNLKWNPWFETEVINENEAIGWAKIHVKYDDSLERYACVSLEVERSGEGTDITGAVLRDMRIAEVIQEAALENIWVNVFLGRSPFRITIDEEKHVPASAALKNIPAVSGRTTDADARHATVAYSIAKVSGKPVLKTIEEALSTSQSTAKRLVARARELGYLNG